MSQQEHWQAWEAWIGAHELYAAQCEDVLKGLDIEPVPPTGPAPAGPVPEGLMTRVAAVSVHLFHLFTDTGRRVSTIEKSRRTRAVWGEDPTGTTSALL